MNQVGCTGIMCKIYDFSPLQHGGGGSELQAWLCEIEFLKIFGFEPGKKIF